MLLAVEPSCMSRDAPPSRLFLPTNPPLFQFRAFLSGHPAVLCPAPCRELCGVMLPTPRSMPTLGSYGEPRAKEPLRGLYSAALPGV